MAMMGAVVRLIWIRLGPRYGRRMGKEKGYITQMIDKMKTTRVPIAGPDTMMDPCLCETSSPSVNEGQPHSMLGVSGFLLK